MKIALKVLRRVVILGIPFLFFSFECRAAVEALESPVLRLEITTHPYSYRVIERATGEVLVSEDNTGFTFGPEFYPVADAGPRAGDVHLSQS